MHKYLGLTLAGLMMLACKDPDINGGLPPEATGPFLPRMVKGWTLDSLTYTADLPMDIGDTTVPVRVHNKARDVSGRFDFFTRNDTDFVDYRIQFTADLLPGVAPYTYSKQRLGQYWYKPAEREIWFYDYPDTLVFKVDWDAETLQLWHSELLASDPGLGITFPLRLDFRLVP